MVVGYALALTPAARAVPPLLNSVTTQDRHAIATFSAPRSDFATIYFASNPTLSTDGRFLDENIKHSDLLTDSEIQSGRWFDESQLDPGTYYVMLRASPDFGSCWIFDAAAYDPACANGPSNIVTLAVPRPAVRYSTQVTAFRFSRVLSFTLRANPMGANVPYRVCARISARRSRCVRGVVEGFSWSSSASDTVSMSSRGLPLVTTLTWTAEGRTVATRRVRTR
jgi:hypothetical protein